MCWLPNQHFSGVDRQGTNHLHISQRTQVALKKQTALPLQLQAAGNVGKQGQRGKPTTAEETLPFIANTAGLNSVPPPNRSIVPLPHWNISHSSCLKSNCPRVKTSLILVWAVEVLDVCLSHGADGCEVYLHWHLLQQKVALHPLPNH